MYCAAKPAPSAGCPCSRLRPVLSASSLLGEKALEWLVVRCGRLFFPPFPSHLNDENLSSGTPGMGHPVFSDAEEDRSGSIAMLQDDKQGVWNGSEKRVQVGRTKRARDGVQKKFCGWRQKRVWDGKQREVSKVAKRDVSMAGTGGDFEAILRANFACERELFRGQKLCICGGA